MRTGGFKEVLLSTLVISSAFASLIILSKKVKK